MTQLAQIVRRHAYALVGATVLSALLVAVSTNIQTRMREAAQRDMEKSLITISETSQQALVSWIEEEKRTVRIFSDNEDIRTYTEALLKVNRNHDDLLKASAQKDLRDWFEPLLVTSKHLGFFVVAPDGISIASARDANIGSRNLLFQQSDFLTGITAGNTLMSHPLRSDVALANEQGQLIEGLPTMFVGAPVYDKNSTVIAALLFRIDPQDDFNSILRRGRIGTSGETYTFDDKGNMISDSRFIAQLIKTDLLQSDASDSLNLAIRDPGIDLTRNDPDETSGKDWPLTFMALDATKKKSGSNLTGYRGYRGVSVVGTWLWNDDYSWGIATEIDVDEAYAALSDNLAIFKTATLVVVCLILSILLLSSVSRHRVVISEKRYRSLFNNTNDAILVVNPTSRRVLDANDRASSELLYDRTELLEMGIFDLHPKSVADEVLARWDRSTLEGDVTFETDVVRKDGTTFNAEISISLAGLEEGTVCQTFIRDITHRKALEEKLAHSQRMETVGTLAGGIAHDFNNLLTPIIGNAQLIVTNTESDSKIRIYTDRIIKTGRRAANLVNQIMLLGKHSEPDMMPVDLSPILDDAIKLMRTSILPSISLTIDIDRDCDMITADASQIHQVIMNLCINASHAMEETGGNLNVSLHPIDADDAIVKMVDALEEGAYAKISISDTGLGMDDIVRRRIFDPFFSTKKKGKGTGLGLSTAHNIITSHGGHITVRSEPGVGSTFNIYLPTAAPDPLVAPPTRAPITGGNEHILIVDDDADNTTMMHDMLAQLGYTITTANSGPEALEIFTDRPEDINLLITDYAMPEMNGDILSQKVRDICADMPVIIVTGFGAALSEEYIRKLNIKSLLKKPFTRQALDTAIREALE